MCIRDSADTGDLDAIKKFQPRDATTNPSLILAAAKNPDYVKIIDQALINSRKSLPISFSESDLMEEAIDQVSVFFGKEILNLISGRVSTEVDARLSFDTEATVIKAKKLINHYKNFGAIVRRSHPANSLISSTFLKLAPITSVLNPFSLK